MWRLCGCRAVLFLPCSIATGRRYLGSTNNAYHGTGKGESAATGNSMDGNSPKETSIPGGVQQNTGVGKKVLSDTHAQFITTTEVSTSTGVRWLDVAGRSQLWVNDSFLGEGEFVAHAMEALRGENLPPDMIPKVSHKARALPFVYIEDNWACLTLRYARQNPRWFSTFFHDEVKNFRETVSNGTRRAKYSKLQENGEDEDDTLKIGDEDEASMRCGREKALTGRSPQHGMSSQVNMIELTDRLHIFLLKENLTLIEGGDKVSTPYLSVRQAEKISQKDGGGTKLDLISGQWRIVTVHRYRMPFLEAFLVNWATSGLHRGPWIGIVRRLVHGATLSIQGLDYKYAERIDEFEMFLFESSMKMNGISTILAQLHIINRRSKIHANFLRETQRSYTKLLSALNLPIELEDQREILYLSHALSLADELHDQSRSLLTLQFSVAAYMLEDHLRILTLFTTFFIPLELITSWFGTNFVGLEDFVESEQGLLVAGIMLVVTAIITSVWMRRHVMALG
ncbi:metal ion transporter, MIT family [Trypanosoma rangeli]|uniref:Metal ion transporter, MIT family n=1 Tax=Trypanosoma rangeli TaxID=5698 RepID=A0A422P0F4_TRYRA|nr:metal ion transporter, MIT family [Trypanosoma rangeli]RNF11206.1 metal ion transporter, MIT family [Trypanosoma rangeli]|eukprot:RNF11206.1 metal ion transporter, MIT family [Trypanosoma rangeli]